MGQAHRTCLPRVWRRGPDARCPYRNRVVRSVQEHRDLRGHRHDEDDHDRTIKGEEVEGTVSHHHGSLARRTEISPRLAGFVRVQSGVCPGQGPNRKRNRNGEIPGLRSPAPQPSPWDTPPLEESDDIAT
jgi:hypothetical protein